MLFKYLTWHISIIVAETYIKVKGKWVYLYRAVDSHGDTLDFMLSEHRDEDAATAFLQSLLERSETL
jgi:putative transposase